MITTYRTVSALFLAIFFVLTPSVSRAQVSEPATTAQVEEMKTALITLLTQLIAQLQSQITELLTQQATQQNQLGAVQTQVATIVENTRPVLGVVVRVNPTITNFEFEPMKELDRSSFTFKSNKTIDASKTQVWVNGSIRSFDTTSQSLSGGLTKITLTPSIYNYLEDTFEGSTPVKRMDGLQIKLVTTDGEVLASDPVRYTLNKHIGPGVGYFKVE